MSTTRPTAQPRKRKKRSPLHKWIPPQHGAWAMLIVPFVVGVMVSSFMWAHVPLFVAWFVGYLWSYYALLAVKTRTLKRVRPQVMWYGGVAAVAACVVLVAKPWVVAFAPVFGVLGAVSVFFARRRDDRSLLNDFALVSQTAAMVALTAWVGGSGVLGRSVVVGAMAVLGYFAGTVLYVKTMIREKGERGYLVASVGYHCVVAAVALVESWVLGLVFAWYALRSWLFPQRDMTPKQVGVLEIFGSLALLAALAWHL